jgi:outer membrane protein OmpA-like peptidoglycan-associated protein
VVVLGGAASSARAQTVPAASAPAHGFALDRFEPAEPGSEWFGQDTLDLRGEMRPAIGLVLDYGDKPYVLVNPNGSENAGIVSDQLFVHVGGSIVLLSRVRVGVSLPVLMTQDGSETGGVVNGQRVVGSTSGGIGDVRLGADVRLVGHYGDALTLAVGGRLWLPSGSSQNYLGDGSVRAGPQVSTSGDLDAFVYSASLGIVYRANTDGFAGHPTGSEVAFGGAAGVRILDKKLVMGPEIWGSTVLADALGAHTTPLALVAGAHYTAGNFRFGAGLGPGLSHAAGTSIFRALASIEYVPPFANAVTVAPSPDRDRDGVADIDDACPDSSGVPTADPQTNGCPPPRPAAPLDRDGDGVADGQDACPEVAGVRSDDPKANGCPVDPDRDKDGILNEVDACPDAAGPKSDDPRTSGCPRVSIKNAQIQILEQPKFDFSRAVIKKESDSLLAEVAKVMNDHLEIRRVTVEGHTDSTGGSELNKVLSQQRAEAVVKRLVEDGVSVVRLSARGMGKDEPIMPNDTDAGRAANRRVEFHIEMQDTTTHPQVVP